MSTWLRNASALQVSGVIGFAVVLVSAVLVVIAIRKPSLLVADRSARPRQEEQPMRPPQFPTALVATASLLTQPKPRGPRAKIVERDAGISATLRHQPSRLSEGWLATASVRSDSVDTVDHVAHVDEHTARAGHMQDDGRLLEKFSLPSYVTRTGTGSPHAAHHLLQHERAYRSRFRASHTGSPFAGNKVLGARMLGERVARLPRAVGTGAAVAASADTNSDASVAESSAADNRMQLHGDASQSNLRRLFAHAHSHSQIPQAASASASASPLRPMYPSVAASTGKNMAQGRNGHRGAYIRH